MLKAGALVLLLIGSIKLIPKLNCIAPCGCDFIKLYPSAIGTTHVVGYHAHTIVRVANTRNYRVRHVEYILVKNTLYKCPTPIK